MNILITGISGLLGSIVALDAVSVGHTVFGISRNPSKLGFDFPVTMRAHDLSKKTLEANWLADIDAVIHCAADTSMGSINHPYQDLINISAVKNLIDASVQSDVKTFIFVSTANTLKPGNISNPGTEEGKQEPSSSRLNYINSKIIAEDIVQQAVKEHNLHAMIVNPTFIINPIAEGESSNVLLQLALEKRILFYPRGGKNIVDARDVSRAILTAIDQGVAGENYLLSNQNYTYKDFFKLVTKEQNRRAILIPIPAFLLTFAGRIASFFERILNKPMDFNVRSAQLLNSNLFYTSQKARNTLNFDPVDLSETIKTKLAQR